MLPGFLIMIGLFPRHVLRRPLDDLVQLSAVQPNAATLRTIIYLDTIAVGHHQIHVAIRTLHFISIKIVQNSSVTFVKEIKVRLHIKTFRSLFHEEALGLTLTIAYDVHKVHTWRKIPCH